MDSGQPIHLSIEADTDLACDLFDHVDSSHFLVCIVHCLDALKVSTVVLC